MWPKKGWCYLLLLMVAVSAWGCQPSPQSQTPTPSSIGALAPTPRPPGKIAFIRGGDIWMMDADGQNQRRITSRPSEPLRNDMPPGWARDDYMWPVWSPDGAQMAFVRRASGGQELWLVEADGTNERQMTNFGGPAWSRLEVNRPTWSPDGKTIAFQFNGLGSAVGYVNASRIMLMDVESGRLRELGQGYDPAWLPDGTALIAGRPSSLEDPSIDSWLTGAGYLAVLDPATGLVQRATAPDLSRVGSPMPSPDGRYVAFQSNRDAPGVWPSGIWILDRASAATYLLWRWAWGFRGAWSPDSTTLAFTQLLWQIEGQLTPVLPRKPDGAPTGELGKSALVTIVVPADLRAGPLAEGGFRVLAWEAFQADWCCKAGPKSK